jgi:nucleotide-binding universal stress UspA family protein
MMSELKRILVPLDGSPLAEAALPLAITLAQPFRSQIILLQVLKFFMTLRCGYQEITPDWETEAPAFNDYQEAEAYLRARQDELRARGFDVRILLCGLKAKEEVSEVIAAQKADLIVMATHGRKGLARWLQGSVADEVVRLAPCPVLLVRQNKKYDPPRRGKRIPAIGTSSKLRLDPAFLSKQLASPVAAALRARLEG